MCDIVVGHVIHVSFPPGLMRVLVGVSGGEDEDADGARDTEAATAGGALPQGAAGVEGSAPATQTGDDLSLFLLHSHRHFLIIQSAFSCSFVTDPLLHECTPGLLRFPARDILLPCHTKNMSCAL